MTYEHDKDKLRFFSTNTKRNVSIDVPINDQRYHYYPIVKLRNRSSARIMPDYLIKQYVK